MRKEKQQRLWKRATEDAAKAGRKNDRAYIQRLYERYVAQEEALKKRIEDTNKKRRLGK